MAGSTGRSGSGWSGRFTGWSSGGLGMGLIVAVLIVVFAGLPGPVVASETFTLAQAVDTEPVTDMRVEEVVEQAQQYQLWIFLTASVLVTALLFAGGLLMPGGFAKAGLRDLTPMPAVVWFFAAFVVYLAV
ncbi:MAG: hypothetical protein AAGA55_06760, partial [Planctomycetota bacterium]